VTTVADNRTLLWSWYSDPAVLELEQSQIFARSWQYAGHTGQLAEPGSFLATHAGRLPIVVVRNREGDLAGFVNVCRHRGSVLCVGEGRRETIQCPYHAWTYGLDGSLRRAPRSEREPGFDASAFSLLPISVDTWRASVLETRLIRESEEPALIDKPAPDFSASTLDGQNVSLAGFRGQKNVVVSFWASWCGPCRLEMPVIDKLSHQYHDQGLLVFGVNDEDRETIRDYIKENGYSFPTLVDEEQEASKLYQVRAIPTTVVIDREGNISSYEIGLSSETKLRAMLERLGIH
jgi:peroxiredoxin/nitrite reductase/ring-hydroxylating ferredoxin subunit